MSIDIFRRICSEVSRKRPKKWRTKRWFLHYDNAPAHRSVLVKDFLAKDNMKTLKHPPYSFDLSTAGFYLSLYRNQH